MKRSVIMFGFSLICWLFLSTFAVLQIALLQKDSEIPIEELLARYKKVGLNYLFVLIIACVAQTIHYV